MAMTAGEIEKLIKDAFPEAQVTITDLAGDGDHWAAEVISASFVGKSRVQQHQMVNAALKEALAGPLHALALTTRVPA
ncbi:BolA/IbaG family iron-sulfur metabolism protein [Pinisolibacter aquiterrae]|jgi:stress-induced morphogen|uniref:BolA/IbaG family iron-sulfur metabolism protein n=1 Tax=Pinisolibacter aquiterrae TaxID=2815579 RepID=UPI001C3E0697|nr:BolA family transcriptional regulator [Pinisolibacter aquiterrae]MBV5266428.1 BolA family transcriptional regulator [Pinisolibacter aquiterrae]MCC8236190.1 BolA family transcriptional regulator [Pinisolibacter aquiterrae]